MIVWDNFLIALKLSFQEQVMQLLPHGKDPHQKAGQCFSLGLT